uniref:NADH-ubiquinone oxidoreductase chain 1 n=1 Tax=Anaticola crassicornis TaxID=160206 RepID=G1EN55_9NEOP|nr:NADH dehydrogenase subunit 1 [Anaticola crassicornis]AEM23857.1 NADH dehydrogenase subunit 1 [Anaticola crassicornis]
MVLIFCQIFGIIVMILLSVAFFSLFERKMMGLIQMRKGPGKVLILGLFQPMADAMKLIAKNNSSPISSPPMIYWLIPMKFMMISLLYWMPLPVKGSWLYMQSSALFIMFSMSLSVYMIIFIGWFSNSKYSLIGGMRSVIQTISYEIVLSFGLFCMCLMCCSINLMDIVKFQQLVWLMLPLMPMLLPLLISVLAETNRTPFDLTEGESELVSGFCVEYGGLSYTLIFLSENASMLFMAVMVSIFMSNSSQMMIMLMIILFVWIRATLPRIRFDSLMQMCWVFILPSIMAMFMTIIMLM